MTISSAARLVAGHSLPAGPWTLVVGMHRSGTSAVTGVLGELGLSTPVAADLMAGGDDNPSHFESVGLADFDDRLLRAFGGSWSGPPPLAPGWEYSATAAALDGAARRRAARAFPPSGPLVWKDPRVCLLLPYWRRLLPEPVAAVFIWRSPQAVARSLQRRDGLSIAHGLALWERYNRDALAGLAGLDALVVNYDDLLDDPVAACGRVAEWTASLPALGGVIADSADPEAAARLLSGDLRHHRGEDRRDEPQAPLVSCLRELDGTHHRFPELTVGEPAAAPGSPRRGRRRGDVGRYGPAGSEGAGEWAAGSDQSLRADGADSTIGPASTGADEAALVQRLARAELRVAVLQAELDRLHSSTSWRLTWPGRAASAWLRRTVHPTDARPDPRSGAAPSAGTEGPEGPVDRRHRPGVDTLPPGQVQ